MNDSEESEGKKTEESGGNQCRKVKQVDWKVGECRA